MDYSENMRVYYTNYVRNSRAVGVMWGIFTVLLAVIVLVAFLQPQWIGDTEDSPGTGYFGLYKYCMLVNENLDYQCIGDIDDFTHILSTPFKASTFFVGMAACICCINVFPLLLLFFFTKASTAYMICGVVQFITGTLLFLGCIIYPVGWNDDAVRQVCGPDADKFSIDECNIRWAFILAIVAIFDAFVMAMLAFILATRQAKWSDTQGGALTKSEINGYLIETESRGAPSIAIQPVMTMPNDRQSEYSYASTAKRSRRGDFHL